MTKNTIWHSASKPLWLHVDILQLLFIDLRSIHWSPLNWSVIFLKSWTSTGSFSNSTGSYVTRGRFSPFIVWQLPWKVLGTWEVNKQALVSQYSVTGQACLCLQLSQKVSKLRGPLTHFLKAFRAQTSRRFLGHQLVGASLQLLQLSGPLQIIY